MKKVMHVETTFYNSPYPDDSGVEASNVELFTSIQGIPMPTEERLREVYWLGNKTFRLELDHSKLQGGVVKYTLALMVEQVTLAWEQEACVVVVVSQIEIQDGPQPHPQPKTPPNPSQKPFLVMEGHLVVGEQEGGHAYPSVGLVKRVESVDPWGYPKWEWDSEFNLGVYLEDTLGLVTSIKQYRITIEEL